MWKPIILDVECIVCNKTLQKLNHDPREATRKMGKITNSRRSRTPNWSLDEKQCLLELIKERKEVVVTKNNNGPNHSEEKDVAWNEILHELSAKFGSKFCSISIKKVKTQWQNMKRIAREEIAQNGADMEKYSRQSVEVCNLLDLIEDGVLRREGENLNNTTMATNVELEIKAECIDDEMNQPSCSGLNTKTAHKQLNKENNVPMNTFDSSGSSLSEQISDVIDFDAPGEMPIDNSDAKKNASAMTDVSYFDDQNALNPLHRELQEFLKYSRTEKDLKMESLKEERQVMRAMRETAELNKIIAEQKLKHVLWAKKQEMAMYSGEPGSGAGKGGGGGGAIREAGGAFGKMEAAREDEYFYKKQKEQLKNLKTHLDKEIAFHQEQIKRHEDAIRRHKDKMGDLDKH